MPAKTALLTDWVRIATAGETMDGREIEEQKLLDAAETYDPDLYTAVIDAEHELEWFGSFGQVRELRTGKNKQGKTTLEARLEPNMRMLEQNQRGQRLFTSCEFLPNFDGTGKAYLFRLALTDRPASLGTSELRFSAGGGKASLRSTPEPISSDVFALSDDATNPDAPASGSPSDAGLLRTLANTLLSLCGQASTTDDNAQPGTPPDMTPEEIKALMGTELDQRFSALEEKLATRFVSVEDIDPAEENEPEEPATPDQFAALQQGFTELKTGLSTLTEKLTAALEKGNGNAGGKQTGAEGSEEPEVV